MISALAAADAATIAIDIMSFFIVVSGGGQRGAGSPAAVAGAARVSRAGALEQVAGLPMAEDIFAGWRAPAAGEWCLSGHPGAHQPRRLVDDAAEQVMSVANEDDSERERYWGRPGQPWEIADWVPTSLG